MAGAGGRERSACQDATAGRDASASKGTARHVRFLICSQARRDLLDSDPLRRAMQEVSFTLQVILVPAGSAVTSDYRTNRIRIFYDPATFAVVQPSPAVG